MKKIKVKNTYDNIPKNYTGIVEYPNGTKVWHLDGKQHREDGPAFDCPGGTKTWRINGVLHRKMGPCTMCKDCIEGNFELCSKPGPAVEYSNGDKYWYLNGKLHRENGPAAILYSGRKEYWLNDKRLNKNKIKQFAKEFGYPIETAIKLSYLLGTDKS